MIIERLVANLPIQSRWSRVVLGSIVAALAVSLSTIGALALLGMSAPPALAAALGVAGGAAYAAKVK